MGQLVHAARGAALQYVIDAEHRISMARQEAEAAEADLMALQRSKLLVTGTGKLLEAAVESSLTDLGCTVEAGAPDRTDRIVRWGEKTAVVEIKGLTKSAKESNAAQLEKWVSEYVSEHDETPKAILAVNAWREVPLQDRNEPAFPDQMLRYCERREHCLVETSQILAAAQTCKTKKAKAEFLELLFETVGRLPGYGWATALALTVAQEEPRDDEKDHSDSVRKPAL